MRKDRGSGRCGRVIGGLTAACLLSSGLGVGGPANAQLQRSDPTRIVPDVEDRPVRVQPGDEVPEIDLSADLLTPGFMLPLVNRDVQEQINNFNEHLENEDWGSAFRVLSELGDAQLMAMVAVGDNGEHVTVKEQLQRQLLALPPAGQRAFRLYFDGQAREMFERVQNHPLPGSDEQLMLAQAIVDRLLASSIGGQAAELLGDLYFERGIFSRAERCWSLALDQGLVTGQDAVELEAKRVLALQRAGNSTDAAALLDQLRARFDTVNLSIGGEQVDALPLLAQAIETGSTSNREGSSAYAGPAIPQENALPVWHLQFLNPNMERILNTSQNERYYYYQAPNYLAKYVPEVVADQDQVYFHWLGVVYAIERENGRIMWQHGSVANIAEQVQGRRQLNTGDVRNYHIAVSRDALLVCSAPLEAGVDRFVLTAYNKQTGEEMWNSTATDGWALMGAGDMLTGASLIGDILVTDAAAYCVVRPGQGTECFLRRFNPATGAVDWTMSLGSADAVGIQHTNIRRMPQPRMLMGDLLLYVLTNNGALLAVDPASAEIRWALRTDPPDGVGDSGNYYEDPDSGNSNNPNGADGLVLHDGVLYAKEHNARRFYAVDPDTGAVQWSLSNLRRDARLVGADDERVFLIQSTLEAFRINDSRRQVWNVRNVADNNSQSAALLVGDHIVTMNDRRLRLLDAEDGRQVDTYVQASMFGNSNPISANGGALYRFDDLLVCINTTDIAAFRLTAPEDN